MQFNFGTIYSEAWINCLFGPSLSVKRQLYIFSLIVHKNMKSDGDGQLDSATIVYTSMEPKTSHLSFL